MRLQQRAESNANMSSAHFNQDSQGSSVEEGGRTPMADEDLGDMGAGGRDPHKVGGHGADEDSDEDLTHVLKRCDKVKQTNDMAVCYAVVMLWRRFDQI